MSVYNETHSDRRATVGQADRGGLSVPVDRPPIIESGEIVRVSASLMVVDIRTSRTGRLCRNVEVGGLGVERDGGAMTSMPKVGDRCLIAHPSDDIIPQILTFLPYINPRDGAKAGRRSMNPGDKLMATGYGNYVHVHAGGVIDIAANPITRRMYVPVLNQIKDFCENYELNTPGGRTRWETRREAKKNGGAETELVWELKEYSNLNPVLYLRKGRVASVTDMPADVIDHAESRSSAGDRVYRVSLDKEGNIFVQSLGNSAESYAGSKVIGAAEGVTLFAGELSGAEDAPAAARGRVKVSSGAGVELAKAAEAAVLGDTFLKLLTQYHNVLSAFLTQLQAATSGLTGASIEPAAKAYGVAAGPVILATKTQLDTISQSFQSFLALDTKLS